LSEQDDNVPIFDETALEITIELDGSDISISGKLKNTRTVALVSPRSTRGSPPACKHSPPSVLVTG